MNVPFSHPSGGKAQKDGRKVRSCDEGTFTPSTTADDRGSAPPSVLRTPPESLPCMNQSGYGRMINVSSGGGSFSDKIPGPPAYGAARAGLNALTVAASRVAEGDAEVNAVRPGRVRTDAPTWTVPPLRSATEGQARSYGRLRRPDGDSTASCCQTAGSFPGEREEETAGRGLAMLSASGWAGPATGGRFDVVPRVSRVGWIRWALGRAAARDRDRRLRSASCVSSAPGCVSRMTPAAEGRGWPGPGACGYTPPHPGTDPAGTSPVRRTGHHRRASRKNRRLPGGLAGSDRPRSACAPLDPGGRGPHSPARAVVLAVPGAAARQARWYRGAAPHAVGHEPGRAGSASSS